MPKSKKPRKARKNFRIAITRPVPTSTLEELKASIYRIEARLLIDLKESRAHLDDLYEVRDVFGLLLFTLTHRRKTFNDKDYEATDFANQIVAAGQLNEDLIGRAQKAHVKVVSTEGEDIDLLKVTLEACTTFIRDQIEKCPGEIVIELNASKILSSAPNENGDVIVTKKGIDWAYEQAKTIMRMSPKQQDIVIEALSLNGLARGREVVSLLHP
jgi:hypothetical protein